MSDFKWRHFQGDVILWAVRWMGERGVPADHSTICRWVQKYAPEIGKTAALALAPTTVNKLAG